MTHTAGIPNYYKRWSEVTDAKSLEELIKICTQWPLEFEPGANYAYSNTGYLLLAYIIEKVSGQTYAEFLHNNIFKPLDMNDTGQDSIGAILKHRANGYRKENNYISNISALGNPVTLIGNGNLYSSLEDMYKWDQALSSEKIISKKSLEVMFNKHIFMPGSTKRAHGYGFFIDEQYDRRIIEYSGSLVGFISKHVKFIDDNISIIILTNLENMDDRSQLNRLYEGIATIIFERVDNPMENNSIKMRKFLQNKLWRDDTATALEKMGSKIHWTKLDDHEYDKQLRLKLSEETEEVIAAKTTKDLASEIADVLEVISALCAVHNLSLTDIESVRQQKRNERGGFEGRKFVTIAEHPVGSFGEKYCLADPKKYPEVLD